MECRILKNKICKITNYYNNSHKAIDAVGENNTLDYVTAHTKGIVVDIQDGYGNMKGSTGNLSYGNFVKLKHENGYYTLYAHMKNGLNVKKNENVDEGQILGYMWDSGNAYGKHLHFEVREDNNRINPQEYLNKDLPKQQENKLKYKIGDIVEINGVYVSSTSKEKLRPLINRGKITKIIENSQNPYLLEDGKVGWVNDNVIVSKDNNRYLSNKKYAGSSIVDALKEIDVDSSYNYRKELAKLNDIDNYKGTKEQNLEMLNLLKNGKLKYL